MRIALDQAIADLNERADLMRRAARQGASALVLWQLGERLTEAETAVKRAREQLQ